MNLLKLAVLIFVCNTYKANSYRHCQQHLRYLRYYKIKNCYKSNLPLIAWENTPTVADCMDFARKRNALAFNFSPVEALEYLKDFSKNCQALGCPEVGNSSTLIMDIAFDYYSSYGNWNTIENSTCIKSVGLFVLTEERLNYTKSIVSCQDIGADLADVLSEVRTNQLSGYINNALQDCCKAAYVGLDDIEEEGNFKTVTDMTYRCSRYRAWAPGHPGSKYRTKNCVILDSNRMWRVVKCRTKLPALCEFYPEVPLEVFDYENVTCNHISDISKKKTCKRKKAVFDLYSNSSRIDRCAIWNEFDEINDDS